MESNHIARPDGARRVNLRVDVWDSSYLLARNELSTHGWRIPSQSVGWQSSPTRSLQNSNNALNLARFSARKELAERVGFVHLRAFGATADLIASASHLAVARVHSRAGRGGWRREWDSNPWASFRFCKLQIPECHGCLNASDAVAPCTGLHRRGSAGEV